MAWAVGVVCSNSCLNFAETSGMLFPSSEKQTSIRNRDKRMNENWQKLTCRLLQAKDLQPAETTLQMHLPTQAESQGNTAFRCLQDL